MIRTINYDVICKLMNYMVFAIQIQFEFMSKIEGVNAARRMILVKCDEMEISEISLGNKPCFTLDITYFL